MIIKFNLLQHQKLKQDYFTIISQNITEDLFMNEVDIDAENSFYVFISDNDNSNIEKEM